MQKKMTVHPPRSADELLSADLALFEPAREVYEYIAYPSRSIPRFIARSDDDAALRFLATLVSADRGFVGALLRLLLEVPVVPRILARLSGEAFKPAMDPRAAATVVERMDTFVQDNAASLPRSIRGKLRIAKFCQRIASPDTKILFLISDDDGPLCIVKRMRSEEFNGMLQRECNAMKGLIRAGVTAVPRVYFDGIVDGMYTCAEEVVQGVALSRPQARMHERSIVEVIRTFPVSGRIESLVVAGIFARHAPEADERYAQALAVLQNIDRPLQMGVTHSDLGRVNILLGKRLTIIDWGRACERPFWLIDAVYLIVRLRRIQNIDDWRSRGALLLGDYTGVEAEIAEALYCIHVMSEILYKKHHDRYLAMSSAMPAIL